MTDSLYGLIEHWKIITTDLEPKCDWGHCLDCDWRGALTACHLDTETDSMGSEYSIFECPSCKEWNIECEMSEKQSKLWMKKYGNKK